MSQLVIGHPNVKSKLFQIHHLSTSSNDIPPPLSLFSLVKYGRDPYSNVCLQILYHNINNTSHSINTMFMVRRSLKSTTRSTNGYS